MVLVPWLIFYYVLFQFSQDSIMITFYDAFQWRAQTSHYSVNVLLFNKKHDIHLFVHIVDNICSKVYPLLNKLRQYCGLHTVLVVRQPFKEI